MIDGIRKVDESTKPHPKTDGAGKGTRVQRQANRLGVKSKRNAASNRMSYHRTDRRLVAPDDVLTQSDIVALSQPFLDKLLQRFGRRMGEDEQIPNPVTSLKCKSVAGKSKKQRSFLDVSKEEESGDTDMPSENSSLAMTLKTAVSEKEDLSLDDSQFTVPRDLELNADAIKFITAVLNENSPTGIILEGSNQQEGNMLGIFHTIFLLVQHEEYLRALIVFCSQVRQAMTIFKSNAQLMWYGCVILEKFIGEESPKKAALRNQLLGNNVEDLIENIMNNHRGVASLQSACCKLLWSLYEGENGKPQVMLKKYMRPIIEAARKFENDDAVQFESCSLLQRLALDKENEIMICKEGGVVRVMRTMTSDVLSKEVVKKACAALWNLSFAEENRIQMLNSHAHKTIFEVIHKYCNADKKRPDIVSKSLGVIWNLADLPHGKTSLLEYKIPEKVVEVMSKFKQHEKVQEMGCGCLRSLAYNDSSRISLMTIGAAKKILESMRDHVKNKDIQYQAFAVLKKLSCNDVNEGRLIKMQAGERILEAMEAHKTIPSIQERACGVLWNLAVNDGHKVKLVRIGCAEKMLQAMKIHRKNESVQYQTCRTLKRLARDSQNEVHLMRLDAAKFVLEAMRLHINNASIQEKGCGVLWNLSEQDAHKRKLMELGAARQILDSMKKHLNKESVQYEACGALKRLAVDDAIEVQLMDMHAARYVIDAMKQHPSSADVQGQACGVLWNLAFNGQEQLMELNAAEQIITSMKSHQTSNSVQEKACGTLWKLAEVPDNNGRLIKLNVIDMVLAAMDNNRNTQGVQYQACGTLWNLAVKEVNRAPLLQARAEERVMNAMQDHRDRPDILHSACGVLYNLALTNISMAKMVNSGDENKRRNAESFKLFKEMEKNLGKETLLIDTATEVSNRLLLANKGAIGKIIQCIKCHPTNADVVFQAVAALNHIAIDPKTFCYFMWNKAGLPEVLKSSLRFDDDNGIQENAASLFVKLMGEAAVINKERSKKYVPALLNEKKEVKISEDLIQALGQGMVTLARSNTHNLNFQQKNITFFHFFFQYVSQEEKKIQNKILERTLLRQKEELKRQDSEIASERASYVSSYAYLGKESFKDSFYKKTENCSSMITKEALRDIMQRTETTISDVRTDIKTLKSALLMLKNILTDAATYPESSFFQTAKEAIFNVPSLIVRCGTIFKATTSYTEEVHFHALSVIRLMLQFGSSDLVVRLLQLDVQKQLLNRLIQCKSKGHFVTMGIMTLKFMMLAAIEQSGQVNGRRQGGIGQFSLPDVISCLIQVSSEACLEIPSNSRPAKLLKPVPFAVCDLIKTINPLLPELTPIFLKNTGLRTLREMLKLCTSEVVNASLSASVLNLLASFSENNNLNLLMRSDRYFKEILDLVEKVFLTTIKTGFGYRSTSKENKNQNLTQNRKKANTSVNKRLKAKPTLRSAFVKSETSEEKKKELMVIAGIVRSTCSLVVNTMTENPYPATVPLNQREDILLAFRFLANVDFLGNKIGLVNGEGKLKEFSLLSSLARETLSKVDKGNQKRSKRSTVEFSL